MTLEQALAEQHRLKMRREELEQRVGGMMHELRCVRRQHRQVLALICALRLEAIEKAQPSGLSNACEQDEGA